MKKKMQWRQNVPAPKRSGAKTGHFTGCLNTGWFCFRVSFVGWLNSGRLFVGETYFWVVYFRVALCLDGIFPGGFFPYKTRLNKICLDLGNVYEVHIFTVAVFNI